MSVSFVSLVRTLAHRLYAGNGRALHVLGSTSGPAGPASLQDATRLLYSGADVNLLDGVYVRIDETTSNAAYSPNVTLNGSLTATATVVPYTAAGDPVVAGDVVNVDSERMLVLSVDTGANTLTVARGYQDTVATTHNNAATVSKAGARSGDWARVAVAGLTPGSGSLSLSPSVGQVDASKDYSLHLLCPDTLEQAIQWALNQSKDVAYYPVSLLTDADMEDADVSAWTAVGVPTITKETDTPFRGLQCLQVDNVNATEGVKRTLSVVEGDTYFISAVGRAEAGTAFLRINQVGGVTIDVASYLGGEYAALEREVSIADGIETLEVSLMGAEITAITTWDDVIIQNADRKTRYRLPASVEKKDDVLDVIYYPRGGGIASDVYAVMENSEIRYPWYAVRTDQSGPGNATRVYLELEPAPRMRVYVKTWKRWTPFTSDVSTTEATEDEVLAGARVYLRKLFKESAILEADPHLMATLMAMEEEDNRVWKKARPEQPKARIEGLRKY